MINNIQDIERQLIGKLLIDQDLYFTFQDLFDSYKFTGVNNEIFEVITAQKQGVKISTMSVAKLIGGHFEGKQSGAINYLTACRSSVDHSEFTDEQLLYLIENKTSNELVKITQALALMASAGSTLEDIRNFANEQFNGIESTGSVEVRSFLSHLTALNEVVNVNRSGEKQTGLKTGLNEYDAFNGGMQFTDLEIIGGKTSMGKTAFVLQRASNVANAGTPVSIFNYEMSAVQLTARIVSPRVPISGKSLLMFPLSDTDLNSFNKAIGKVDSLPIYIAETRNSGLQTAIKQMRYMANKLNVKYFIFDFVQRMKIIGFKGNREQEIGTIAQALKDEAKALNVKVDLLSQLNRDKQRDGREPILGDLRESGQLEEAADIVTFIHRPEYYLKNDCDEDQKGKAKIIQAKGRNVGVTEYWVGFNSEYTEFYNLNMFEDKVQNQLTKIEPNYDF